jgi:hypothetical protein
VWPKPSPMVVWGWFRPPLSSMGVAEPPFGAQEGGFNHPLDSMGVAEPPFGAQGPNFVSSLK